MSAITTYRGSIPIAYAPSYSTHYPVEYFSGIDVSIFFGEEYIDEINNFEFTLREVCMPVYSYASYTPNRIINGSRLVTGSFQINMRPGNYLHEILNQDVSNALANSTPAASMTVALPGGIYAQPDPSIDPDGFAAWVVNQKRIHWDQISTLVAAGDSVADTKPYFNNSFTILMAYGDLDAIDINRNIGRVRTIERVKVCSVSQPLDMTGNNINESFMFVAADFNGSIRDGQIF
jgi:hypothetical protein